MRLWRVSTHDRFDGEGARSHGARWNHAGTPMIYMSGSLALALLEVLANLRLTRMLSALTAFYLDVDERHVSDLDASALPRGWDTYPWPKTLQDIGTAWANARSSLILSVPSAVLRVPLELVQAERNYLIDPAHEEFRALRPQRVTSSLDPRLIRAEAAR